jgi:glycosyltransferase involved in cell wall biosynthesis
MRKIDEVPVSVVIPCFRCSLTIKRAVISVFMQSVIPSEVILIDDASGDATLDELISLQAEYPGWIKVIKFAVNRGAASARNAGLELASKAYIAFLDSDDAWHPRKIEIQLDYMRANPDVVLSGHGYKMMDGDLLPDWNVSVGKSVTLRKYSLLLSNKMVTPSMMIRRDVNFRFLAGRRYMEDQLFILQIGVGGWRVDLLGADLVATYKRSFGAGGLSSHLLMMELAELDNYRILYRDRMLGVFGFCFISTFSILKFIRRIFLTWCFKLRYLF